MKKYEILNSYVVFRVNETKTDYALKKGDIVELPETNIAVRALIVRGQIKELPGIPATPKNKKQNA